MESPPSYSTNSEAPVISEDSGLILTSGSFSSDSASGWPQINSEIQESDYDDKSLSLCESVETSERMVMENFNTVKKGPNKVIVTTIEPPPQFQDSPPSNTRKPVKITVESDELLLKVGNLTIDLPNSKNISPINYKKLNIDYNNYEWRQCLNRFASPRILHLSPCHARPASRNSLNSRLSSSHNSLTTQIPADDSTFITQAISHDTLTTKSSDITVMYNVPFDSDIYALPIDMIRPNIKQKIKSRPKYRKRNRSVCQITPVSDKSQKLSKPCTLQSVDSKRYSLPGTSFNKTIDSAVKEPLNMTLHEVRKYLNTLYSSSSDSESRNIVKVKCLNKAALDDKSCINRHALPEVFETVLKGNIENNNNVRKFKKNSLTINVKTKKEKDIANKEIKNYSAKPLKDKKQPVRILTFNLRRTFCNLFGLKRSTSGESSDTDECISKAPPSVVRRALPPLPKTPRNNTHKTDEDNVTDFATSIEKVKDYGWYWGPLSVEGAEKILSNEPDGSFIVRDSSDDHYIFTLTFKLNGMRHVRIEHEQGNFCFGGCTMFKAQTIVEFIENAVETSRSGRYLFFLNLRPALGPVRVQLLYPVSRFKRVQSLQHMCRFVILKVVRRDLINKLPLPRRILDYLSAAHYYSELLLEN